MNATQLSGLLNNIRNKRIAVVGDFFLDKILDIDRSLDESSLETGLTAYQVVRRRPSPGAAGTVTNNLAALGVGEILAIGATGDDGEGYDLRKGLRATGVDTDLLIRSDLIFTPTYTKPMFDGAVETNRLDIRNRGVFPAEIEAKIIASIRNIADEADAIIALDQVVERNTGVVTDAVRKALAAIGREKPGLIIFADSRANIRLFDNIIVKCNHSEVSGGLSAGEIASAAGGEGRDAANIELKTGDRAPETESVSTLKKRALDMSARTGRDVYVTWGERGIIAAGCGGDDYRAKAHYVDVGGADSAILVPATRADGPTDICGAGDAATAGIVCALCCGASRAVAAMTGNLAAGVTVQKIGVTGTASICEIIELFEKFRHQYNGVQ